MAKDRRKLQHIHSSIADRQPTPQTLEVGEIAVNNAAEKEFISLKNTDNKVVRISSDKQMITWMEKKEVMPYSGTVENVHLDTNRSNIEIKLNQVAASTTKFYDKVNGAKDIDGQLVNPSTDGGLTNGAGFAIDMSRYAMIGANPSFSSLTVTDKTDLSGNTTIANGDGSGTRTGHTLTIKTTDVVATDTNWTETITNKTSKITTDNESATTRTTVVGTENLTVSGTTTEAHDGNVTINNKANVTETTTGNTTFKVSGETTIDGVKSITIQATDTTNGDVNIYAKDALTETGKTVSITGTDSATIKAATTTISGATTNVTGTTVNISGGTGGVNVTGDTTFEDNVTIKKDLVLSQGIKHPLSWEYGSVTSSVDSSYNGTEDKTITIPQTLSDVSSGKVSTDASGNLNVDGKIIANSSIHSSDRDLKENIEFVTREDFNKAKNVAIKSFNFKDDENKNKIYGVIAQETQEAGLDELVYQKEDGHLAVDYTSLMILKIAYLEDFCAHLNGKIVELEDKLAKLENKD